MRHFYKCQRFMYQSFPLIDKSDYQELFNEINAYAKLEKETFDFGEGLMYIEGMYGSENAYYKIDLSLLEIYLKNIDKGDF